MIYKLRLQIWQNNACCKNNLINDFTSSEVTVAYLQVNALSEWIIGIYLHEFANKEREMSKPHKTAEAITPR